MENLKIVIAGGSGFMGQELVKHFGIGNEVTILSRSSKPAKGNNSFKAEASEKAKTIIWDAKTIGDWATSLEGCDLLINLTGKSVNCRYTESNKAEIINSRVESTNVLGKAIQQCTNPPKLWINLASATIYPNATDHPYTEKSVERESGFSVHVCQQWEAAFNAIALPSTRKIILRCAIVLGNGGVMVPYTRLVKMGLGSKHSNGQQMVSWVHEADVAGIIQFLWKEKELSGVFNASAPEPIPNTTFMKELRKTVGMPIGLPSTKWMLKIGAMLIGTETELLLKSRWVLPERLLEEGYQFQYPKINGAFENLLGAK